MNYRLISELERQRAYWSTNKADDTERLRFYQQELLAMRQLSPRPRCTVSLTLRQCAAARKVVRHAASALAACKRNISKLSGTTAQ